MAHNSCTRINICSKKIDIEAIVHLSLGMIQHATCASVSRNMIVLGYLNVPVSMEK